MYSTSYTPPQCCIFHANCSSEFANCILSPLLQPRRIRFSTHFHPSSVHFSYAKINQYLHSFFLSTGKLWNSLPESVFLSYYNLNSFKRTVARHLQLYFGLPFIDCSVFFREPAIQVVFFLNLFNCTWPVFHLHKKLRSSSTNYPFALPVD